MTPLRVSVRPDFDALDVSATDGPARTKDGRAWARWAKYGSYSGWYAVGARKPKLSGHPTFWEAVFSVACACAGGNVDQTHCCGRGVLALGGLGVTLRSGYAQMLLHCCLLANPARYVEVMAPVLLNTAAYTKACAKSPSGIALHDTLGGPFLSEEDLRRIVLLGSDSITWTTKQKSRARTWVSCCSELLRDEAMDRAQQTFAEEVMPALLTDATQEAIRWPSSGPRDWWQYTREQQMLWALALVLALEDEVQTEGLVLSAHHAAHVAEEFSAEAVLKAMASEAKKLTYDVVFRHRYETATKLLAQMLQVAG